MHRYSGANQPFSNIPRYCLFTMIPFNYNVHCSLAKLVNLEQLILSGSERMAKISPDVFSLQNLIDVNCDKCIALTVPPYDVCVQGPKAVQKYLFDLEKDRNSVKFIPVTVIGKSMAGKTSLVRSIQQNKRVLTYRSDVNKLDEATKVFTVCEADIGETKLVFHDFGGQAIYHFAYQLAVKSQQIPLLVIDIADFQKSGCSMDPVAACRDACYEWLSHLYLACPQMGFPLILLTHRDGIGSDTLFESTLSQLIQVTEALRCEAVNEERAFALSTSNFFSMKSFCDLSAPLMSPERIKVFSKTSGKADIDDLKDSLLAMGSSLITEIPESWYLMMVMFLDNKQRPFITVKEVDEQFPHDENHVALEYMHRVGRIMWYKEREELAEIVFHRNEVLTEVIRLVLDHESEELWAQRVSEFSPFMINNQGIDRKKFTEMVEHFQQTGMMNEILLVWLLDRESELPCELATAVLKTFHLICGPINVDMKPQYFIPYFATNKIDLPESGPPIPLKIALCFNGLPIPIYIYHMLSAAFVNFHVRPASVDVGTNGASVIAIDGTVYYLLHLPAEREVAVLALTSAENMATAWLKHVSTVKHLETQIRLAWKGAHYDRVSYCSHCLLLKQNESSTISNPLWLDECSSAMLQYSGKEIAVCQKRSSTQRHVIPYPLLYPCKFRRNILRPIICQNSLNGQC